MGGAPGTSFPSSIPRWAGDRKPGTGAKTGRGPTHRRQRRAPTRAAADARHHRQHSRSHAGVRRSRARSVVRLLACPRCGAVRGDDQERCCSENGEGTHSSPNVVQHPVVVRPTEVDVERVFCDPNRLQPDVQDVLCPPRTHSSAPAQAGLDRRDPRTIRREVIWLRDPPNVGEEAVGPSVVSVTQRIEGGRIHPAGDGKASKGNTHNAAYSSSFSLFPRRRPCTPGWYHSISISPWLAASVVATMFVTADCRAVIPAR